MRAVVCDRTLALRHDYPQPVPAEEALAALARAGARGVLKAMVDFR